MKSIKFETIFFKTLQDEDILYIRELFTQPISSEFKIYTLIYLYTNIELNESLEKFKVMYDNPNEILTKIINSFTEMMRL